jgi:gamma-glutamylcyclotransferase (GGCT)/AIG2-like uncharacterized protein YtfP
MTLYFAYGSNMSRALMRRLCPTAKEVGTAVLEGHRFVITADGFASIERHMGGVVHGVLWRLTPRDFAALNIYESVGTGLYHCRRVPVRHRRRQCNAFVYVARPRRPGRPRPGYLELVMAAARDWNLPQPYVGELARWSCSGLNAARSVDGGEIR